MIATSDTLVLDSETQGSMVGQVKTIGPDEFRFGSPAARRTRKVWTSGGSAELDGNTNFTPRTTKGGDVELNHLDGFQA